MSNKTKVLLIATFLVSIVGFLSVFRSEKLTSNVIKAQTEPSQLSLKISKSQESYLKAESISINLELSNQTDEPISCRCYLGVPYTNFTVTNAAGVKKRLDEKPYITPYIYVALQVMQPGEQIQKSSLLVRDLAEELFPSPGQYELQVEFVYDRNVEGEPPTKILSNSISLKILEPEGINKQAYQFLKEKLGVASSYQLNTQALVRLEQQFVDKYRNSVYAKYIIFSLGNSYQTLGDDVKALRELCKVSGENFHYTKDVERVVLRVGDRLNPVVYVQGAPPPILRHPCTNVIMN